MRYSHTVTVEDPDEGPIDLGPMTEREARDLVAQFTAEGVPAHVRDLCAEAAVAFPVGATVRHRTVGRTGVVSPVSAANSPVSLEPGYDLTTRISVVVDHDASTYIHLRGDLNGWFVAEWFAVVSYTAAPIIGRDGHLTMPGSYRSGDVLYVHEDLYLHDGHDDPTTSLDARWAQAQAVAALLNERYRAVKRSNTPAEWDKFLAGAHANHEKWLADGAADEI